MLHPQAEKKLWSELFARTEGIIQTYHQGQFTEWYPPAEAFRKGRQWHLEKEQQTYSGHSGGLSLCLPRDLSLYLRSPLLLLSTLPKLV